MKLKIKKGRPVDSLLESATPASRGRILKALPAVLDHVWSTLDYGAFAGAPQADLVVSLTTTPGRQAALPYVLESILRQTLRPAKVVVWSSDVDESVLDAPQSWGIARGTVEIRRCVDLGQYRGVWFCSAAFPGADILTIDDTTAYPSYLVERLVDAAGRRPGSVAAGSTRVARGGGDGGGGGGGLSPDAGWPLRGLPGRGEALVPGLRGGVLYPAGFLAERDLFRLGPMLEHARDAADIWLKAAALKHGLTTVQPLTGDTEFFGMIPSAGDAGRPAAPPGDRDRIWAASLAHFGLAPESFTTSPVSPLHDGHAVAAKLPSVLPAAVAPGPMAVTPGA